MCVGTLSAHPFAQSRPRNPPRSAWHNPRFPIHPVTAGFHAFLARPRHCPGFHPARGLRQHRATRVCQRAVHGGGAGDQAPRWRNPGLVVPRRRRAGGPTRRDGRAREERDPVRRRRHEPHHRGGGAHPRRPAQRRTGRGKPPELGELPRHGPEPDLQHRLADAGFGRHHVGDGHRREDTRRRAQHRPGSQARRLCCSIEDTGADAVGTRRQQWPGDGRGHHHARHPCDAGRDLHPFRAPQLGERRGDDALWRSHGWLHGHRATADRIAVRQRSGRADGRRSRQLHAGHAGRSRISRYARPAQGWARPHRALAPAPSAGRLRVERTAARGGAGRPAGAWPVRAQPHALRTRSTAGPWRRAFAGRDDARRDHAPATQRQGFRAAGRRRAHRPCPPQRQRLPRARRDDRAERCGAHRHGTDVCR